MSDSTRPAGGISAALPGGRLYKVSGAGNDFLALIEPERDPTPREIAAWCARGFAFGADGVFVLRRDGDSVGMRHWNSDGGPVEVCLNATRCATRLAFELGWAESEVTLRTGAGPIAGRRSARAAAATIVVPGPFAPPVARTLEVDDRAHDGWFATVGVPHFILVEQGSLASARVRELGPPLRRHAALGPGGANVDWVRFPAPGTMEIRTFERGVEGETLACGTGILASVLVGLRLGALRSPIDVRVLGGFSLTVDAQLSGGETPSALSLEGDARILARLELEEDAARRLPTSPRWSV